MNMKIVFVLIILLVLILINNTFVSKHKKRDNINKFLILSIFLILFVITILYRYVLFHICELTDRDDGPPYGRTSILKHKEIIEGSLGYRNIIPKILHMTYHTKEKIPSKVYENIKKYANNYKLNIYNDIEGELFIKNFFSDEVVEKYKKMRGAHKADLLRYCLLYIYGGVYADIKTVFIKPLDEVIPQSFGGVVIVNSEFMNGTVYNGFIACPPGKDLFLKLIEYIMSVDQWMIDIYYLILVDNLYFVITNDLREASSERGDLREASSERGDLREAFAKGGDPGEAAARGGDNRGKIIPGINFGKSTLYYSLYEKCNRNPMCIGGLDQYFLCCNIYDPLQGPVIKTRYSDYPW